MQIQHNYVIFAKVNTNNMKTIENKTTTIIKTGDVLANYGDLFISLLNKPLQKMLTVNDMRRDIKLIDKLETTEPFIEVTDDEFNHLFNLVETSEWAIRHKDIIDFDDYIRGLAKV